ncbi:GTP-binding protein [Sorangium cellulosum]|uniref:GTPase Der n=1 Tax=Sorangium cellulosum TaxID=56 RepID=A0A150QP52_SORCE|nr:GTP-binding protein [Sorangium cellulosum]
MSAAKSALSRLSKRGPGAAGGGRAVKKGDAPETRGGVGPRKGAGASRTGAGASKTGARASKTGAGASKTGASGSRTGAGASKTGARGSKTGASAPGKIAGGRGKAAAASGKAPAAPVKATAAPRKAPAGSTRAPTGSRKGGSSGPAKGRAPAEQGRFDRVEDRDDLPAELAEEARAAAEEAAADAPPPIPSAGIVALVGRPNTGKSTLFNRLVGRRVAIVHDEPGVTRDRHYGDVTSRGRRFTLVDTGGFDPESDDPMRQGIKRQIDLAIAEADVIVCVLDAVTPVTPSEHAELGLLRRAGKPVIYVANKADSPRAEAEAAELYRLGMERLILISALHGRGISDLEMAIEAALPAEPAATEVSAEGALRIAIVGRPNAGKSSLVNRISGEERMLVDAQPGTTRDPIDTLVDRDGKRLLLIDTAGIRRKAKVTKEDSAVEAVSVMHAIRAMERADVVLLLCDAAEGVAEQDAKILGLAVDRGCGIVIGLNKLDLLDRKALAKAEADARDKLAFVSWAPIVQVSARSGRGVAKLLETVGQVAAAYRKRVPTGELNRFFEQILLTHPPPTHGGRAPRLFFVTQAETSPPLFVVVASDPEKLHFSYRRYVANQLRQAFGLEGVPVRVKYKERRRRS